jgi:predicted amidohydrolase
MASSHVSTPILHVGVYQGGYAEGVEANLKLLQKVIEEKRDQKVDLVIFAELFLCGYCIGPKFNEVAEEVDGPSFQFISNVAKKNNTGIAYGYAERYLYNILMCFTRSIIAATKSARQIQRKFYSNLQLRSSHRQRRKIYIKLSKDPCMGSI